MSQATLRIATFNVENLFARYRFRKNFDPVGADGFTINDLAFEVFDEAEKRITARAIKEVKADVLCLQEVENLLVLDLFNSRYLAGQGYRHRLLIDGNDPRRIDVAALGRFPFLNCRTHREERNADNTGALFSRDCLEVEIGIEGRSLTLYANHFKSMMEGRDETRERRLEQTQRVAALVDAAWRPGDYQDNFIVLGDFHDYVDPTTSLKPLVEHPHLVNGVDRLPQEERWTHYFAGGQRGEKTRQLDYLLVGKALDERAGPCRGSCTRVCPGARRITPGPASMRWGRARRKPPTTARCMWIYRLRRWFDRRSGSKRPSIVRNGAGGASRDIPAAPVRA